MQQDLIPHPHGGVRLRRCPACSVDKAPRAFHGGDGLRCRDCVRATPHPDATQQCRICKAVLPSEAFHRDRNKPLGIQTECKQCKAAHMQTPRGRYTVYKGSATSKGRRWELSFEQFMTMWRAPCHYCRDSIETIGIDRVDPAAGYVLANCVPCCTICNQAKMDRTVAQFKRWVARVHHQFSTVPEVVEPRSPLEER